MADEGNLGFARALETEKSASNADFQSRMGETRESISETIAEMKASVVNQYDSVKETVGEVLDWREQVRRHPVACSVGVLGLGVIAGYGLAELIEGNSESDASTNDSHAPLDQYEGGGPSAFTAEHSYAAHARAIPRMDDEGATPREDKPGLIGRFKETRVYDRLEEEVADLGNRFMDELADTARSVVLPALFNKLKDAILVGFATQQHRSGDTKKTAVEAGEHPGIIKTSEVGKPAYPSSTSTPSKFDRLESNTPTPTDSSDSGSHINMTYDDRYERESKLFSRGDIRGFDKGKAGDNKPVATDRRNTASDEAPRGKDFALDPGHTDNS